MNLIDTISYFLLLTQLLAAGTRTLRTPLTARCKAPCPTSQRTRPGKNQRFLESENCKLHQPSLLITHCFHLCASLTPCYITFVSYLPFEKFISHYCFCFCMVTNYTAFSTRVLMFSKYLLILFVQR